MYIIAAYCTLIIIFGKELYLSGVYIIYECSDYWLR